MGLLSDPEYGSVKWVRVLKKIHEPLCFMCFVGALVWFIMLGNREFNNETYFSENALLPGLVTNEFNGESAAERYYTELLDELEDKYSSDEDIPLPWLMAKMTQLHLEVYTQNFTLMYPLGRGQLYIGTNVYGILRAPRTASLEALVVSVPYRYAGSTQKGTAAGIALMLAFAKFARPQKYWAKDIIFLVTEHEQLGMQAWLEAYHGISAETETFYTSFGSFWPSGGPSFDISKYLPGLSWMGTQKRCLDSGKLKGRSGSIQAAINLEFHSPKIKYIEVKIEGLNGKLPNLDLVNLVHKLCVKSGIHHSYRHSYSWMRNRNKMEEWKNGVWTMFDNILAQIDGVPDGNHGLYHRFGIEAVTLEGRAADDPAGTAPRVMSISTANFHRLGVALESILRSLNNLLERFHQSYFFYLLASTNRFISIGQYMPCLCLLCVAILVRALSMWVSIQQDEDDEQNKKTQRKTSKQEKKSNSDVPGEQKSKEVSTNSPKKLNDSDIDVPSEQKSKEVSTNSPKKLKDSDIDEPGEEKTTEISTNSPKKLKDSDIDLPGDNKRKEVQQKKIKGKLQESSLSIVNIGSNYLLMHLIGYALMNSPPIYNQIGIRVDLESEISVFYGLAVVSVLLVFVTPFLLRMGGGLSSEELSLLNILVLVELATVCLSVGMHNFSLGFFLAVAYTPLALITSAVHKGFSRRRSWLLLMKRVLCLLLHPLFALTLTLTLYSMVLFPEQSFLSMLSRGRDATMQVIMFAIVDSKIYGNWAYNLIMGVVIPIWLLFWQILTNVVKAPL